MLNTSDFNLQFAVQTARGAYPTNPTYRAEIISGTLQLNPNVGKLNVGDSGLWTPSFKRTNRFETGGTITVLAQPLDAGALIYYGWGALADAGGGDPYTHTITPATSASGFPYVTFWQYVAGRWVRFNDCQVTKVEVTVANDASEGFMLLTLDVVGMLRPKICAAPGTPATAETDAYHWLDATAYWCLDGDFTNLIHTAIATDLATAITLANAMKAAYNLHCAVATGRHHQAADGTNTVSALDATDLASLITLLTEIKTDWTAHIANTTVHYFADTTNGISHANPTDLATCLTFLQEFRGYENSPGDYNAHLGATAALKSLTLVLDPAASTIQGEDVTPYAVQRKRGMISVAAELLAEDLRLINLAQFGDIAPAAETQATDDIQLGSLVAKFTASTSGAERSLKISVPQFDYDPSGMQLDGNAEGGEAYITVGGEASGTAPIATVTVLNSATTY